MVTRDRHDGNAVLRANGAPWVPPWKPRGRGRMMLAGVPVSDPATARRQRRGYRRVARIY